jgi:hypothetical protein
MCSMADAGLLWLCEEKQQGTHVKMHVVLRSMECCLGVGAA